MLKHRTKNVKFAQLKDQVVKKVVRLKYYCIFMYFLLLDVMMLKD